MRNARPISDRCGAPAPRVRTCAAGPRGRRSPPSVSVRRPGCVAETLRCSAAPSQGSRRRPRETRGRRPAAPRVSGTVHAIDGGRERSRRAPPPLHETLPERGGQVRGRRIGAGGGVADHNGGGRAGAARRVAVFRERGAPIAEPLGPLREGARAMQCVRPVPPCARGERSRAEKETLPHRGRGRRPSPVRERSRALFFSANFAT